MRFSLLDGRVAALGFPAPWPGVAATLHLLPALGVLGAGPAWDWLLPADPFLRPPVPVVRVRLRPGPAVGGGKRFAAAEPMSALRRSGYGPSDGPSYGRYYGPGGGDVPVHVPPPLYPPLRPEPPQPPVSWRGRGGAPAETTWPGEGAGGDAYYPSGGAWAEPGRAGGGHQVSFAVFSRGSRKEVLGGGEGTIGGVFRLREVSDLLFFRGGCRGTDWET